MKKSLSPFLFPLAVMLLSTISLGAFAQDDGITSDDVQNFSTRSVEHENKTTKSSVITRDSLQMSDFYQKPKADRNDRKATESASGGEEDDALSLNFLYYIIENYKFSDLMDK